MAGSETMATVFATMTYYLLRNLEIMRALKEEIQRSFQTYDEINAKSTQLLQYLYAVMLGAMRICPLIIAARPSASSPIARPTYRRPLSPRRSMYLIEKGLS
jgi:cytochrome P450